MARELAQATHPVLHAGRWCLRPLRLVTAREAVPYSNLPRYQTGSLPEPPQGLERLLHVERFWTEDWYGSVVPAGMDTNSEAVLPLRAPSPEDDGRVKSWRKHARQGTLPPALLLYLDIFEKWCVLDGHDRLHAALLEGISPPLLGLWPVFEEPIPAEPFRCERMWFAAEAQLRSRNGGPEGIDKANRTLLREYEGVHRVAVTRAWPVRGGLEAWRAEVLACRRWNAFPADAQAWDWFASLTE